MDSNVLLAVATITAALAGGGIASVTALVIQRQKTSKVKEGFIQLLICDIASLLKIYDELIGKAIKEHNEENIFTNTLAVNHNFFSVFDNNSDKILYLNQNTAKLVVELYNRGKAHIDTVIRYGDAVASYNAIKSHDVFNSPDSQDVGYRIRLKQKEDYLRHFFTFLKNDSIKLKQVASIAVSALEEESSKYKKKKSRLKFWRKKA